MGADYSLEKQFETVQGLTKLSHVCKYGEDDLKALPIGTFQLYEKFPGAGELRSNAVRTPNTVEDSDRADVREVELKILKHRYEETKDPIKKALIKEAIEKMIADNDRVDRLFKQIVHRVTSDREVIDHPYQSPRDYACLKASLDDFEDACGVLSAYGLKYVRTISALCDHGFKFERIHPAIRAVCHRF